MAAWWMSLLLLGIAGCGGVLQVHGQVDNLGFISLDCGLPENAAGYVDSTTKLRFTSDAGFINAGTNHNMSSEYITPLMGKSWHNVRSFGGGAGARSCYTLGPLVAGLKHLVRAKFMYGNYDGLNKAPVFDLHVGVNYWTTVNISNANTPEIYEIIAVVPGDSAEVCLVNTGSGTPFISALDLRPLENGLYPMSNSTQGLVLLTRSNFGPTDGVILRYPDDPHDRFWIPQSKPTEWSEISTAKRVHNMEGSSFDVPSAVMQTAVTPINSSSPIQFTWDAEPSANVPDPGYICILHFSELQPLPVNALRQFYVTLNGQLWLGKGLTPQYLYTNAVFNGIPSHGSHQYNVSLNATTNSTVPPILNAIEIFSVLPTTGITTATHDVSAMAAIRGMYKVKKNWMGDPCMPKNFAWKGLGCSYTVSSPPIVTGLNLSSSGLSGNLSSSFAGLKGLQYLDLSRNNLTGSIPDTLSQLSSLTLIDLTDNQLNGSIPPGLVKRTQDGSLTLRYGNNPNICSSGNYCRHLEKQENSMLKVIINLVVSTVLVILLLSVLILYIKMRRRGRTRNSIKRQNEASITTSHSHNNNGHRSLRVDNRQLTYSELEAITNGFQRVIGQGGFGKVYHGLLEDGTQVAVKLRSNSSDQGEQEFLAEAQTLAKIHHKNLVSLIGYCKNREYMALVYEYMSQGALDEHLKGKDNNPRTLTWRERLCIALESAKGLEYLHRGCNPPLIHRDVKTSNILLNAQLEAKIADFGLLKAFHSKGDTHVSTATVVGTLGYLDPEYHATYQLTNKSDVFSFGVVLLEIVTGQRHILKDPEPISIVQSVRQRFGCGNIEGIVDSRMCGDHDVNGVWKIADTALKCTARNPLQRPTMTDVVAVLQECLELEVAHDDVNGGFYSVRSGGNMNCYGQYDTGSSTNVSQSSTMFELKHLGRVPTMSTDTAPAIR
ncbi:putative leucine-rich repeat receptor-like serine/threonine-protein kinase At2g19230 [Triticum dicoccoides]|uniref:putative leucine-rich repeat receptor-like serine/threonine-protein kinase At2g19230 n=1 Tax=Triticum dicoccoides TaxID=85692 RepID=UPI00188FE5F5|nr:putative leucine-rich repeat receptor-like serine/threonine-protein kinase At2g19230 [Triticum dicoccoides]